MKFTPGDVLNPRYAHVFVLTCGNKILSTTDKPGEPFLSQNLPYSDLDLSRAHYIGDFGEQHCFVLQVSEGNLPQTGNLVWLPLRELLGVIADTHFQMLGRALQITRWYREHRYCGICGQATTASIEERSLTCSDCNYRYYPRISPCIICLVTRGEQCLLARHARLPATLYTTLAGFVEPGETAEEAVHREIYEEVSIRIKNLRYIRSQPWPFPGQLMLGFMAEYESGELIPDGIEVLEAGWFDAGNLPSVPPASTISAQLIRSFVEHQGKHLV